jgi:TP901 family phage tail tape measure protein
MNVSILVRLIDAVSGPARRVAEAATLATKSLEQAGIKADELFKSAGNLKLAADGVGRFAENVTALVREPVKLAGDFEEVMRRVTSRAKLSTDEISSLTSEALKIGSTTSNSAQQAAEGMLVLARNSANAKDIIATLPSALNLVEITGLDLAATTSLLSQGMKGFSVEAARASEFTDALVATSQRTSVALPDLAEAMALSGKSATQLGLSFHTTAAMIGLLANRGIEGRKSAEALKAMVQSLVAPSELAGKAFRYLGITLKDPKSGELKSIDRLIGEIAKKTEGMGSAKRARIANAIFGESGSAVVALMGEGADGIKHLSDELARSGGIASTVAEQAGGGMKDATQTYEQSVKSLKLSLGQTLVPAITEVSSLLSPVIAGIGEWTREHPKLSAVMMIGVAVVGAFATGLHGLLLVIATAKAAGGFGALAGGIADFAKIITGKAIPATLQFTAALLTNPFVLIGLGIAAVVAGIVLLVQHWDAVTAVWDRFVASSTAVKVVLGGIALALIPLFGPLMLIPVLMTAIAYVAHLVIENWEPIKGFFASIWNGIVSGVKWAVEALSWLLDPLINHPVIKFLMRGAAALGSAVGSIASEIGTVFTGPDAAVGVPSMLAAGDDAGMLQRPRNVENVTDARARERAARAGLGGGLAMSQRVEGTVRIELAGNVPARVTSMNSSGGINLEVSSGLAMAMP